MYKYKINHIYKRSSGNMKSCVSVPLSINLFKISSPQNYKIENKKRSMFSNNWLVL